MQVCRNNVEVYVPWCEVLLLSDPGDDNCLEVGRGGGGLGRYEECGLA